MTRWILLLATVVMSWAPTVWAWSDDQLEHVQLMEAPLLGPPRLNLYGPGLHGDATGQVFQYETQTHEVLTVEPVKRDADGIDIGLDVYGRPVRVRSQP